MSEHTPTPPTSWWKQPRTIAWTAIIAVFAIAAILITVAFRGALAPAADTDSFLDTQEIEDLIEAESPDNLQLNPELLEAGYTLPKHGVFCDDEGDVVDEWERIDVQYSLGLPTLSEEEAEKFSPLVDSNAVPMWLWASLPGGWKVSKISHPVIDINTLTDGDVIDLTEYTTPGTFAIFVDGCDALPPQDYSSAYEGHPAYEGQGEPPFLHHINADGSVNIAVPEVQNLYQTQDEPTAMYSAVRTDIAYNTQITQQTALYPLVSVSKETARYQHIRFPKPALIFTGVNSDPISVDIQLAAPNPGMVSTTGNFYDEYEVPNTVEVSAQDLIDDGFCFPSSDLGMEVTIIENPTESQLPEYFQDSGDTYQYLVTDNLTEPISDPTACPWLLADITRN